jgi:hypothetical protein
MACVGTAQRRIMVQPTGQARESLWRQVVSVGPRQLELPYEGMPNSTRLRLQAAAKEFATGLAPRLGSQLLMRFGVPMVGAITPVAIGMFAPQYQDDWRANLIAGSGLGGAWGAMVGGILPFNGVGERIPRLRSAGVGAAAGIVMAPAIAAVSKYAVDWLTSPLREEGMQGRLDVTLDEPG